MVRTPTEVQLFRFSAATSNPHRIHFDLPYAQSEGYPGVVVQSHLHASFLAQAVCDWAGSRSRLKWFRWENRALAVAGDTLTITGFVSSVEHHDGVATVSWELEARNQYGTLCAPAWARVEVPEEVAL